MSCISSRQHDYIAIERRTDLVTDAIPTGPACSRPALSDLNASELDWLRRVLELDQKRFTSVDRIHLGGRSASGCPKVVGGCGLEGYASASAVIMLASWATGQGYPKAECNLKRVCQPSM